MGIGTLCAYPQMSVTSQDLTVFCSFALQLGMTLLVGKGETNQQTDYHMLAPWNS